MEKTDEPGIYLEDSGRYTVKVTRTSPKTGKRVKKESRSLATLEAALAARDALTKEILGEPEPTPSRETLSAYAVEWVEQREAWLSPSAARTYRTIVREQILPVMGDLYVDAMERSDVLEWVAWAERQQRGDGEVYAQDTLAKWHRVLITLLKDLVADRQLRDITARIRPPRSSRRRVRQERTLTRAELAAVLEAARTEVPDRYPELLVLAYTGMRSGELWAARWCDLDGASWHVCRTVSDGVIKDTTKTGYERHVYLPPIVVEALAAHRKQMISRQHRGLASGLIFPSDEGTPRTTGSLVKACARVEAAAEMECHISPQIFRRSFNTLLAEANVDHLVIQSQMGHSSGQMTKHYFKGHLEAKERAFGQAFTEQV